MNFVKYLWGSFLHKFLLLTSSMRIPGVVHLKCLKNYQQFLSILKEYFILLIIILSKSLCRFKHEEHFRLQRKTKSNRNDFCSGLKFILICKNITCTWILISGNSVTSKCRFHYRIHMS